MSTQVSGRPSRGATKQRRQRLPHQVLHREEVRSVLLVEVVYSTDVGVMQLQADLGFVSEHFDEIASLRQVVVNRLQRDETVTLERASQKHGRHAASSKLHADDVRPDTFADVGGARAGSPGLSTWARSRNTHGGVTAMQQAAAVMPNEDPSGLA